MTAVIYVPQGRSAKLTSFSLSLGVNQLYTDGFTTCNIIVGVGEEKVLLVHADLRTDLEQILQELEQTQIKTVSIIYREQGKPLLRIITTAIQGIKITARNVDNECDGVLVSLPSQETNVLNTDSLIELCSNAQKPQNIFHHPQEQYFLTIQKIEQVIGVKARKSASTLCSKQLCIYDGIAWLPIKPEEQALDLSNKLIKEELDNFDKEGSYLALSLKLAEIIDENNMIGDLESVLLSTVLYLESYLNDYDCELIFKRNMLAFLSDEDNKPCSAEDGNVEQMLLEVLKSEQAFDKVSEIISNYRETASTTAFKVKILKEF